MEKICRQCSTAFDVTDEDLAFYDKVSPVFGGKKYQIPPPTFCPMCRLQRRLVFRNHNYVYLCPSSTTGKNIFSMWIEEAPFPIMNNEEWWGDSWNGLEYGRDFDFDWSFFEQFVELRNSVPHLALDVMNMENSAYCNNASNLKNCYLVFNTDSAEDCMSAEHVWKSKDCIDCTRTVSSELCYNCIECFQCYCVQDLQFCDDCSDSFFLLNCRSCKHCFGCVNLRRKEYCIFNEQKSREEYEEYIRGLSLSLYKIRENLEGHAREFFLHHPRPHVTSRFTENTSGNFIFESKEVHDSFFIREGENLRHCLMLSGGVRDCVDLSLFGAHVELLYESDVCGLNAQNLRFCYSCWDNVSDLLYCWQCIGSNHCFGCVGLQKKQYCILNKQYSKEEYEELVPKIIEHMQKTSEWGEYFPVNATVVPYNHSLAQRYFPLSREDILEKGFIWYDKESVSSKETIDASNLPDSLPNSDDPVIVRSVLSSRPFKITSREIKRYREFNIPLPRLTYDERMEERAMKLGGIILYERECAKTGKPILTTYPPDSSWIIWDKDVYEQEFGS